ncbi:HTH-type transcriptional regulator [Dinoroseobacter shibae DFL 12 = DSM 16493]|jgi:DNA-binding transcriptional LysR family regulator|uniref:HTH-type transcriptional regulator n=1 Tax=Dinoroseobacter shibae (strain DSM 16493 / NCIMB 14021 / DFL 12) TaxID=398580 RepID=A8LQJ4_DINSH|nr:MULTISPECIES: LysR substrate-binding domain-containing protein [Dinoroseobacter]ABV93861.1 HTH-type transcriptional regulator [Dinoroseobacter shibae DFL 12 = DSM 16493]MDD9716624.1 LysR substrate-binding domain-containing protein [Dinoroseobacter sp. PD6]URF45313.1 LysR substrate-binding domain-containing protein [Dinoroseobacter shibae]URF49618.1 LysR substrate-binding domain-containing protein [Dinoroseobacter shibae]
MARKFTNLQTDLLRTFVTVVDLRNYTETGRILGRTQPAISLQIKRLEEITGKKLLAQQGKQVELTPDGQTLLGYAREMLRLNDRAVANLQQASILGTLRVGLPVDYAIEYFQSIITRFARENPAVQLDIRCNRSPDLLSALHVDDLDMTIAITDSMPAPHVSVYWSEHPVWVCARDHRIDPDQPLKVVAHPNGCFYRKRMIDALNTEGRDWRISFESLGVSALQKAVLDGMGVTALTKKTLLPGMRLLSPGEGFPNLANIHVGLFYKHVKMSDAALKLIEKITEDVSTFRLPTRARTK